MQVLRIEETPNPNARKFVLDKTAFDQPISFFNADMAKGYELAEQLFAISGVAGLLFLGDFVTINKSSRAKWTDIIKRARQLIESTG